nr:uncharacterized protein LOC113817285 [Penaeus vannamei]
MSFLVIADRIRVACGYSLCEEFNRFTECWGVRHLVMYPHYPQSNGHAEAVVKSVKYLILKTAPDGNINCEAFQNTPTPADRSPAQILYGHPLRTPSTPSHLQSGRPSLTTGTAQANQVTSRYDSHARPFQRLSVGHCVCIQDHTSLQ